MRFLRSTSSLFLAYLDKSSKVLTADDNMKSLCAHSGMKGQVGGFQNPGFCLQAFPSFPSPSFFFLALAPFFARAKHRKSRFFTFFAPQPHGNACRLPPSSKRMMDSTRPWQISLAVQSNLNYPGIDYPDFFPGPVFFFMNINQLTPE